MFFSILYLGDTGRVPGDDDGGLIGVAKLKQRLSALTGHLSHVPLLRQSLKYVVWNGMVWYGMVWYI